VEAAQLKNPTVAESLVLAYRQSGQIQKAADLLNGLLRLHARDPRWAPILQSLKTALQPENRAGN
jgi:hypothetical protein